MYYYLKGSVVEKENGYIVVDVLGVGYQVYIIHDEEYPLFSQQLVYLYHVVREDEEYFVGFTTKEEKEVFTKLISVKGIGPRTAISALKDTNTQDFINMIKNEDIKRLKKLSGIGPKAAAQIILDLKGSLVSADLPSKKTASSLNENKEYAKQGLVSLGFKAKDCEDALNSVDDETLSIEEYVTIALKKLRS